MQSSQIWKTDLMPHQGRAVDKLRHIKVGALLMDMGTGKSRTAMQIAAERIAAGKIDCALWLCPVSVQQTIMDEVTKHCTLTAGFASPGKIPTGMDIIIAGIESLSSSTALNARLLELVSGKRVFLIVDESSLIKNPHAKRTLAVWRLGERCRYRMILNGTPLTNNEKDIFAQWYFLDPRILGYTSFYSFAANHLEYDPKRPGRIVRAHNVKHLVQKMSPYLYQVRKEECLSLPPKTYATRCCDMTRRQRQEYEDAKERCLLDIDFEDFSSVAIYRMFTALQRVVSGVTWEHGEPLFSWQSNPRVDVLLQTLEQIPDRKVIIWCKYHHEIETLRAALAANYGEGSTVEIHGKVPLPKRREAQRRFERDAQFLLVNKSCAAYGLNLQHCQYAIYYSNDFTWGTRAQSEERIHRHGQTGNVHIIDMLCECSIDERIYDCLNKKENLVDSFKTAIDAAKDCKDKEKIATRWLRGK